ncbi:MAG: hypothetical protein HY291_01775 [Planctomycetes bacterium]|nr:hypothetical protein [Planctomycetota bacterium]
MSEAEKAVVLLLSLLPCAIVVRQRMHSLRKQGRRFQFSLLRALIVLAGAGLEAGVLLGAGRRMGAAPILFLLIFPTLVVGLAFIEKPFNADPDPVPEEDPEEPFHEEE